MNRASFVDKRRNKKLRPSFDETHKSLCLDEIHDTMDDFLRNEMFPNSYMGHVLAISNPTDYGRSRTF